MSGEGIITLDDTSFNEFVGKSDLPVLVDFWAGWCGPCKMIAPVVEEMASEFAGQVKFAKMNVDENQAVPASFKVISIPTLILFVDGQEVGRAVGYKTKDELRNFIKSHV